MSKNFFYSGFPDVKSTLTCSTAAQIALAAIGRYLRRLLAPVKVLRYGGEVTAFGKTCGNVSCTTIKKNKNKKHTQGFVPAL